jgi:hypothetical protein
MDGDIKQTNYVKNPDVNTQDPIIANCKLRSDKKENNQRCQSNDNYT